MFLFNKLTNAFLTFLKSKNAYIIKKYIAFVQVTPDTEPGQTIQTILTHGWTVIILNAFQHIESVFTWIHWGRQTQYTQGRGDTRKHHAESKVRVFIEAILSACNPTYISQNMSFWKRWFDHQDLLKFGHSLSLSPFELEPHTKMAYVPSPHNPLLL
jgi:hypothetical protein